MYTYFVIDTVQELPETTTRVCVCVYTHTEEGPSLKMVDNARFDIHGIRTLFEGRCTACIRTFVRSLSPPAPTALRVAAELKRLIFVTIKTNGKTYVFIHNVPRFPIKNHLSSWR